MPHQDFEPAQAHLVLAVMTDEHQLLDPLKLLQERGIATAIHDQYSATHDPLIVLLSIPANRLEEAILTLDFHGFTDVRAYGPRK